MSLTATIRAAVDRAFAAAGDAQSTVTVRLGPTSAYDVAIDQMVITWDHEDVVQAIGYDEVEEDTPAEFRIRAFAVRGADLSVEAEQEGEIVDDDGLVWQIFLVEPDPTESIWILHCRNPQPDPLFVALPQVMGLFPLTAIVRAAVDQAFVAAGDVKRTVVVRMGPTSAYDVASDTMTTTWDHEDTLEAVGYAEVEEDTPAERRIRAYVVKGVDLSARAEQEGEIVDDGLIWQIFLVEPDPTDSAWILHCRNPQPVPLAEIYVGDSPLHVGDAQVLAA
jgi:hypothetical protein